MRHLYLFTASYPYDRSETFLEDEVQYLTGFFKKVTIVPLFGQNMTRDIPEGCEVLAPVESSGLLKYFRLLVPNRATLLYMRDFFESRVYMSQKKLKTWLIAFRQTCSLLGNEQVRSIFANIKQDDICYFYWGKGSNVLSVLYKKKAIFVSRFHGEWDLWEESAGNYAPLRRRIAASLNLAAFISKKGEKYFCSKYNVIRTIVSPLGSLNNGICKKSEDGVLRIVSCSLVYPLKRVFLIHDSMLRSDIKIEWTHIGGGEQYDELKKRVTEKKRDGLKVNLLGQVSHGEVLSYYKTHRVDAFINLSTNEGVPVSIMEAISFDIPVLATDVGATSEVVRESSGILLSPNPTVDEVADAIGYIINNKSKYQPRKFWRECFDAEKNYKQFAEIISNL